MSQNTLLKLPEDLDALRNDQRCVEAVAVISHFKVANGMTAEVKAAFRARPHLVDGAPGFLRMEVLSPLDDADEVWLLTFWKDLASYQRWHRSHLYHEAHSGIPKGLKLVPGATKIRCFEHVCS